MALHESEVAQCPFCGQYSWLWQLRNDDAVSIKISDGSVKVDPQTNVIGRCPRCGTEIEQGDIC